VPNITVDLNELASGGVLIASDELVSVNGVASEKQLISSIPLGIFNNDQGWTSSGGSMNSFNVQANGGTQVAVSEAEELNFINGTEMTAVVVNQTNPTVTFNHTAHATTDINTSGANIVDVITTNSTGHITAMSTRLLTAGDISAATDSHTHTTITTTDESIDTTTFPLFVNSGSNGVNQQPKTGGNLTFNSSSGALSATIINSTSDVRLKAVLNWDSPSFELKAIKYDWKDGVSGKSHYGYSAQDAQKVLPQSVTKNYKGELSVNYAMVHTVKIAQLEAEIANLKELVKGLIK
jgi:hypothetical protein